MELVSQTANTTTGFRQLQAEKVMHNTSSVFCARVGGVESQRPRIEVQPMKDFKCNRSQHYSLSLTVTFIISHKHTHTHTIHIQQSNQSAHISLPRKSKGPIFDTDLFGKEVCLIVKPNLNLLFRRSTLGCLHNTLLNSGVAIS